MRKIRTASGSVLGGVAAAAVVACLGGAAPASATPVRHPVEHAPIAPHSPAASWLVLPSGSLDDAAAAVTAVGGTVRTRLTGVGQLIVTLDGAQATRLQRSPTVRGLSPDTAVTLSGQSYDQLSDPGAPQKLVDAVGARDLWRQGITGRGVDVAVLDTGVSPSYGLETPGKIVLGADLSFDSQDPTIAGRDTYGHGTHIAGIIAGRDPGISDIVNPSNDKYFGVAPDARIVSIKLGDANGAVDITQVIAGIDWVVQHKNDNGLNIRVLNLSYGTDSTQPYQWDPLAFAAEMAWKKGIVVVAAAGNAGTDTNPNAPGLTDPAYDPTIIAVGATDMRSTSYAADDSIPSFSSRGANGRDPDVVAPGRSLIGIRVVGSSIDQQFGSSAEVGGRFFRGSGTSQAAGVVSGGAALILQKNPSYNPDQVKALLKATATSMAAVSTNTQGSGEVNFYAAATRGLGGLNVPTPAYDSPGTGTLEGSRGTDHVVMDGVALTGEKDIFGVTVSSAAMAGAEAGDGVWIGGFFNSVAWTGEGWTTNSWAGRSWIGVVWSGRSWTGRSWTGRSWTGRSWTNMAWSGGSWGNDTKGDAKDAWSSSNWG